jgi:hypothetical protein
MTQPVVTLGQRISIGQHAIPALVRTQTTDGWNVAYLQGTYKVVEEEVIWSGAKWEFRYSGPSGKQLHGVEAQQIRRQLES